MTDPSSITTTTTVTTNPQPAPAATPTVHADLANHIKVLNDYLNAEATRHEELKNIVQNLHSSIGTVHTRLNNVGAALKQYQNAVEQPAAVLAVKAAEFEKKVAAEVKLAKQSGFMAAVKDFWSDISLKTKIATIIAVLVVLYGVYHFI